MKQENNLKNVDSNIYRIINVNNLINNFLIFKKKSKNSKICAVVKANAYGIGDDIVVKTLKRYVDFFAVANDTEAIRIRNFTNKPILILGEIDDNNIEKCIRNNISISISSGKKLSNICKVAKQIKFKAKIHFKINSGMNRLGFKNLSEFKKIYNKYYDNENITYEGIFTHIYDSNDIEKTNKQKNIFDKFISSVNCNNVIKHIASTSVVLNYEDMNYDMCRIGIGLYNYALNNKYGLKPVLQIKTKIINIIKIKKNEHIGYGEGFISKCDMKIGVLPIGYADGYLRQFSNKAKVIINNNLINVIGNVCMDMCFIDITNCDFKIGEEVIVLGKSKDNNINANDLAKIANTIDYEILTNFNNLRASMRIINDN